MTILTIIIHLRAVIPESGDYQHQPLVAAALTTVLAVLTTVLLGHLTTSPTGNTDSGAGIMIFYTQHSYSFHTPES